MDATTSWWGSGLFTIAGAVLAMLGSLIPDLLNRRSERRRLSRDQKETDYPALLTIASRLTQLPVWPVNSPDPDALQDETYALAQRIAFFSPSTVSRTLPALLTATSRLATTVTEIRSNSQPTHSNGIDQRYARQHQTAVTELNDAIRAFVSAARADLEIRTPYTLVHAPEDIHSGPSTSAEAAARGSESAL
jgi:hypothetical protein